MRPLDSIKPGLALAVLIAAYVAVMSVLAAQDTYFFVRKSAIVPAFCLVALLSRQLTLFVRDWTVFLGLTFLFDALRGTLFALIAYFDLPVYMGYAIAVEHALLGGRVMPIVLQDFWYAGTIGPFEQLMVVVHASHFVFFLTMGLAVWLLRREAFGRYCALMVLVMFGGLAVYALLPTVPPWMASAHYEVIGPVERISAQVYNRTVPRMFAALATNPVAAMPSLHAAFPAATALVGLQVFGWRAWWTVPYTLLAALSVMYLGEHYLVDVLAGWLLAAAAWAMVYWWRSAAWAAVAPTAADASAIRLGALRAVIAGALLVAVAEGAGTIKVRLHTEFVPTGSFIDRELVGISPKARHYKDLRATQDTACLAR